MSRIWRVGATTDLSGRPGQGSRDLHLGVNACSQVGSGVSVDPDEILGVIRSSGPGNGIDLVFSFDLYHAAVFHAQAGQGSRADPGHALSCIFVISLGHPKLQSGSSS